ncbi:MAG: RDD family protein [Kiritimatiellaeota bacterium]|nr:RDD family protein [Kiritimatiellota bacterium]
MGNGTSDTGRPGVPQNDIPAGAGRRIAAFALDCFIVLGIPFGLIAILCPPSLETHAGPVFLLLSYLYFALLESSSRQATLGMDAVGLRVADTRGGRLSFRCATVRYICKLFFAFPFFMLYDMEGDPFPDRYGKLALFIPLVSVFCYVPFSRQKRSIIDFLTKTCVRDCHDSCRQDILMVIGVFLAFSLATELLFPVTMYEALRANLTAVSKKGKHVYAALVTTSAAGQANDYASSTDYLNVILNTNLTAESNMWAILMNVTDDLSDTIPLMITSNVDIDALNHALRTGITSNDFLTRVKLDSHSPPLYGKGFVAIQKGGGIYKATRRYCTLGNLFGNIEIQPRPESEPPFVYLRP